MKKVATYLALAGIIVVVGGASWLGYTYATHKCVNSYITTTDTEVFWDNNLLVGADPKTFCAVGDIIGIDAQSVFLGAEKVEGADPRTFTRLNADFFADANSVYWFTRKIEGATPSDFKALGDWYSFSSGKIFYESTQIEIADVSTFTYLKDHYAVDAYHTYNMGLVIPELPYTTEAAPLKEEKATLLQSAAHAYNQFLEWLFNKDILYRDNEPVLTQAEALKREKNTTYKAYSRTDNSFYYDGRAFTPLDPDTFVSLNNIYAKDKQGAYMQGGLIEGADAATFTVVDTHEDNGGLWLAKDKDYVYYNGEPIAGLNPATLQVVGIYLFDNKGIVYNQARLPGTGDFSAEQFKSLTSDAPYIILGRGKIIAFGKIFPLIDGAKVKVFAQGSWTDGMHVYSFDKEIVGSLPGSFMAYENSYYSKDAKNVYYTGKLVGGDPSGFQILSLGYGGYIKTSSYVAYDGKILTGALPATFKITNQQDECAQDGAHYYLRGELVSKQAFASCGVKQEQEPELVPEENI